MALTPHGMAPYAPDGAQIILLWMIMDNTPLNTSTVSEVTAIGRTPKAMLGLQNPNYSGQ